MRVKRTVDYIEWLCSSELSDRRKIGQKLKAQYVKWTRTLNLNDFLNFLKTIQRNKQIIGVAQFFGKFRAYAFEEYVYRLLKAKIGFPKSLSLFWGEKCLVWRSNQEEYSMEFDVSLGKKMNNSVNPVMVFDAKVELDAARLKTALASFILLKNWNSRVKCFVVYVNRELNDVLLNLTKNWIDGFFSFNDKRDETEIFLEKVRESLAALKNDVSH